MNRKTTRLGCTFVLFGLLTACSDDQGLAQPQTETGGTAGSGGSGVSGSAGSGGTDVGSGGTAGASGATGGTGGGGSRPDAGSGACGPLRGEDPTEASVQAQGTFAVMSYIDAPASTGYKASSIYYPSDATPPFVGVAAVPGLNGVQRSVSQWGTFLASHGYAVIVIDTNSTSESPTQRSAALIAAIATLKAENARPDSPLSGKISDCMVIMGHSMGGGGAVIGANANSSLLKGAIGLSPYGGGQSAANITVPTLLFVATGDPLSTPGTHVKPAYQAIPEGTSKMYLEFSGGSHDIAQYPIGTRTTDLIVARYGLSWLKFNVEGDARYRQFLNRVSSGLADYQTNLP
jgi:dienelactone hydrolase